MERLRDSFDPASAFSEGLPARGPARFVVTFLVALALFVSAVGAFNRWVDPAGMFGPPRFATETWHAERAARAQLIRRQSSMPGAIILGSSRMQRYDPRLYEKLTGKRAINLAVNGGLPRDSMAIASFAAERWEDSGNMPHVVVGVAIEEFQDRPPDPNLLDTPDLNRQLPRAQRGSTTPQLSRFGQLLTVRMTRKSFEAIRAYRRGGGAAGIARKNPYEFREDGMSTYNLLDLKLKRGKTREDLAKESVPGYAAMLDKQGRKPIPDQPIGDLRRLLKVANAHGDEPTVMLLPAEDIYVRAMRRHGRDAMHRSLRRELKLMHKQYRFTLVDYSNDPRFFDPHTGWFDQLHPTHRHARKILRALVIDARL